MNKIIIDGKGPGEFIIKSSEGTLTDEEATQILNKVTSDMDKAVSSFMKEQESEYKKLYKQVQEHQHNMEKDLKEAIEHSDNIDFVNNCRRLVSFYKTISFISFAVAVFCILKEVFYG